MRISVTDRCNLRCTYCMPEEGIVSVSHDRILRYADILRICRIGAALGIHRIKLTGGEPLVRRGVVGLIREIKAISGIEQVTMTTNGVLLAAMYDDLVDAGLDAVTISLDTLNREKFRTLTRRDALPEVLAGLEKAVQEGRIPVKINCVAMADTTAEEFLEIAELARQANVHVRFIELMPIGLGKEGSGWAEDRLMAVLENRYGTLHPYDGRLGNGPARYVEIEGFCGKIGWISAVSHAFCSDCNRVRLTSEGFLKCCLQYNRGVDLRPSLSQEDDGALLAAMREGILMKPEHHSFGLRHVIPEEESRKMSQIGG